MKSILQDKDGTCFLCRKLHNDYGIKVTQEHHVIFGRGKRNLSEKYGLKVYLCLWHHGYDGGTEAVHRNHNIDIMLKRIAQEAFICRWPKLDFREIFGKSYLEEGKVAAGKKNREQAEGSQMAAGFRVIENGLEGIDW